MDIVPDGDHHRKTLEESCGTLLEHEKEWRDRHSFLVSKGYTLRPRLRPGWIPSWTISDIPAADAEDGWLSIVGETLSIFELFEDLTFTENWFF